MGGLSRRGFVKGVATTLPVLAVSPVANAVESNTVARLDARLLRALADVVLPSELGAAGMTRAVDAFQAWLAAYDPVAERAHGYGTAELEYLPPDPAPGWTAQLQALDLEAERRHGRGFADLDVERRRALVLRHLGSERGERVPAPLEARHVAIGLLAWWLGTPEANDLCHRAAIGRQTCRPLDASPQQPSPIQRGG